MKTPNILDRARAMGVDLFPAQRVILKAFCGIPLGRTGKFEVRMDPAGPRTQQFTEASFLRFLHAEGRCNIKKVDKGHEFNELVLCMGRRAGKSVLGHVLVSQALHHLESQGDPWKRYGLSAASPIQIALVGPSRDAAETILEQGRQQGAFDGHWKDRDEIVALPARNLMEWRWPGKTGKRVRVVCQTMAPKVFGGPNFMVVMDELPWGKNPNFTYLSLTPSVVLFTPKHPSEKRRPTGLPEGRLVSLFTPPVMQKDNDFAFQLFQSCFQEKNRDHALCVQLPSWMANPTLPRDLFAKEKRRAGRAVFWSGWGAEFVDEAGNSWCKKP